MIIDLVRIAGGRIMNQMPGMEKIGAMYAVRWVHLAICESAC